MKITIGSLKFAYFPVKVNEGWIWKKYYLKVTTKYPHGKTTVEKIKVTGTY
jgi:hypothetical protein